MKSEYLLMCILILLWNWYCDNTDTVKIKRTVYSLLFILSVNCVIVFFN